MAGIIDVAAGIVWRDGRAGVDQRFLAVDRPAGKPMAGFFEFPGGKCRAGESPALALERELIEELDIRPTAASYWREAFHEYPHATVRLHFFHVLAFAGIPSPLEGQRLVWVRPGRALDMDFLPADREILAELARLCETKGADFLP